jgi:NTE family protein
MTEAGIVPDLMTGSSAGSINAVAFAADPSLVSVHRLQALWLSIRHHGIVWVSVPDVVRGLRRRRPWLVAETGLRRLLAQELSGRRLEDGRPGAYVVATEMGSGRARVIAVGDATEALLARAALPEVFPPVTIEGYFLVDVGSATNLPVAPAETLGATDVNVLAAAVPGRQGRLGRHHDLEGGELRHHFVDNPR